MELRLYDCTVGIGTKINTAIMWNRNVFQIDRFSQRSVICIFIFEQNRVYEIRFWMGQLREIYIETHFCRVCMAE